MCWAKPVDRALFAAKPAPPEDVEATDQGPRLQRVLVRYITL